ncbi:quercetin dioxygenase-like cupin family protein [Brevibacterium sanguinis]|uniref:Quercetin dioxygenase-like cupin family protein n=2 Tax=Brevibacterium TaxID=1696 RepID=A0A366IPN0_9MICO|nr:quercetin dioxygenase-like cupin family protein [Brevibacterium sanguinis]RBP73573.1 quercetin dioxygenase-like cupin family protein [Brevibacterium celere]
MNADAHEPAPAGRPDAGDTDGHESPGSTGEVQLDNGIFRVTKWTIDPGGRIPMHRHDHEYVVVPLVTAAMHVRNADGTETVAELATGASYTRPAGSEHEVSNPGDDPVVFVEVERLS